MKKTLLLSILFGCQIGFAQEDLAARGPEKLAFECEPFKDELGNISIGITAPEIVRFGGPLTDLYVKIIPLNPTRKPRYELLKLLPIPGARALQRFESKNYKVSIQHSDIPSVYNATIHPKGSQLTAQCHAAPSFTRPPRPVVRSFGGEGIQLTWTVNYRAARIEFDCASIHVAKGFKLNEKGLIEVDGLLEQASGFPIRPGFEPAPVPVHLTAWISRGGQGGTMTLAIKNLVDNTSESYSLREGEDAGLKRCL